MGMKDVMKPSCTKAALLFAAMILSDASHAGNEASVAEGPYFGQQPPGLTPEVFAPGIISKGHRELSGFFSPDMTEYYYTLKKTNSEDWWLVSLKQADGRWTVSGMTERVGRPIVSPDGKTMHLGKHYRERAGDDWGEMKSLGPDFEDIRIMRLSATLDGTYVFDEAGVPNGDGIIRYSHLVDGVRQAPEAFGTEINTGLWNAHPFVAPDGSYIIWDGERESGQGDGDLYISFQLPDGTWTDAQNMGAEINTAASEAGAYVSPDGKYLFFNRVVSPPGNYDNIDIFWVDAKVIENLRPQD
ncbi:WD40-like Beta Propeller Repeat [Kordiimonas lacus]|uniref:WD40-like Beta Propeller Repeat n=2 Tax=Kordiimonas lacus TaxID=637679 RepID=A0A1G7A7B3_9PROT|nr:WD40-like Beta Propeller Repeat [Kordiimonas lacus]